MLIADVPQIVYDLLTAEVHAYVDMEVVGHRTTRAALMSDVFETGADVVILEAALPDGATECRELLYAFPRLGALAMSPDQRLASLYEMRPHETALDNASPAELVAAIRAQWMDRARHETAS